MIVAAEQKHSVGYYSLLGFEREPFATSPDPDFFYPSQEHDKALTMLLIELRLRRGLSVILGDVGTGKTTMCRKLLHELNQRRDMIFHMILNPHFGSEEQFLIALIQNFSIDIPSRINLRNLDVTDLRDLIEQFLIRQTIEENKTVMLIIDEAQKLDEATLETLRVLLNFETNDHKLIQIVLMGQLELYAKIVNMDNFMDRISFRYTLNPLDVVDTKALIDFRIQRAGYRGYEQLFSDEAVSEIYVQTKGYPRKINMLCHKVLKELVIQDKKTVDRILVQEIIERDMAFDIRRQN
ncbi:MAG: AAA family ATPase [Candidatus Omnitrophica bacterium]|nr:AAA family ATPase [Candidatus Omnitrophota bacterium]